MLKAVLLGNLGSDPDLRYSQSGSPFLRFSVATSSRVKGQNGEWKDETTWVRVTVTGKRAETLSQYLHKGSRVYVEGRLEARPWTGNDGSLNAGLEVLANEVQFANTRQDEQRAESRTARTPAPLTAQRSGVAVADPDDGGLPF